MDFIYDLYKNDNFTLYLTIALVILIVLFVIVLVFGKKDQKLEETKRLQKIEEDSFKEVNTEPKKLEVETKKEEEEKVLPVPEVKEEVSPSVEVAPEVKEVKSFFDETQVIPKVSEEATVTTFEPEKKEVTSEPVIESPVVEEKKEEVSPIFSFDETKEEEVAPESTPASDTTEDIDLSELNSIKDEFDKIEVPVVEEAKKEEPTNIYKATQPVFSSVFVPKKEEEVAPVVVEESPKEEVMPKEQVTEPVVEKPSVKATPSKLFSIEDDDETIELPSLKSEAKETPLKEESAKTFSFDDVSGETYNLR